MATLAPPSPAGSAERARNRPDVVLFGAVLVLSAFGLLMIYAATRVAREQNQQLASGDMERQMIFFTAGVLLMVLFSVIDYRELRNFLPYIAAATLVGLLAVFAFDPIRGAQSWIPIGGFFQLQPSEFGKVVAILVVAALLGAERGERDGLPWKRVAMCTAAVLVPAVLIARQPDLGTTMALPFILVAMLFAGGLSLRQMGIIVGGGLVAVFAAIRLGFLAEHQMQRIRAFIDPELSTPDALFQLNQSKLAIGSGQMFGKGLFNGAPTAVPDQQNDFIFSVIGEQFGFVGGILVLGVFLVIVWRLLIIAAQARDTFGQMAAVGIAATVAFHVFVNIGMTIGMAPVTGLPLPFVSQGGSFYLAMAIAVGIANSIWLRRSPIPGETYIV